LTFAAILIFIAGAAAGAINSIAGGGTLIAFPTLLWLGRGAIAANATCTVAMWPGSLAGAFGFRRELATARRWLLLLILPSIAGGALGAWLLLRTPTSTFERLVPFLILGATILLALQETVTKKLGLVAKSHESPGAGWMTFVIVFQFLVSVYGGYFGAGMGILMLAALGLIGMVDMHQMNGVKNVLAVFINGIAAIYFALANAVAWSDVLIMMAGTLIGGYFGAHAARRLGRGFVRKAVIAIGIVMSVALFFKSVSA
jgi:uncharacterized protein